MKEMIRTIVEVYNEDPKEFKEGMLGGLLIFTFMVFIFWFTSTFMYDMMY